MLKLNYMSYVLSRFPEPLTTDEHVSLDSGTEVTKSTVSASLSQFGITDNLPVIFRKCGDDLHVYLQTSPVAFSAYCVGKRMCTKSRAVTLSVTMPVEQRAYSLFISLAYKKTIDAMHQRSLLNTFEEVKSDNIIVKLCLNISTFRL